MKAIAIAAALAIASAVGLILTENTIMTSQASNTASRLPIEGRLPSFEGATGWLNSEPLTPADLRGKVVVVDFWTYSCINWLRTQPYVRAWAEKYKDDGLVVIGVHTPEFGFEKNVDNIRWAARAYGVDYPIAIDSNYGVWDAFANHYWPALYIIDAEGRIRFHHFGEGEYERAEQVIQDLLAEAGKTGIETDLVSPEIAPVEVAADWATLRTGETYVGLARAEGFSGKAVRDRPTDYEIPAGLWLNQWALAGNWTMGSEAAVANAANGRLAFRFHARDLNLVMGPATPSAPIRFKIRIDGKAPGPDAGFDVDAEGNGTVANQRLYQLVRNDGRVTDRTFEIEFLDPGVELFVFTFG